MILHSKETINGMVIEKYTGGTNVVDVLDDGTQITSIIEYPDPSIQIPLPQPIPQPTNAEIRESQLITMDALATVFEEILNLQMMVADLQASQTTGGGV